MLSAEIYLQRLQAAIDAGIDVDAAIGMPDYLGEQTITCNNASQAATLPTGTRCIVLHAEGGAVYACVNAAASASSGVYCPADQIRIIGPYANITSLAVFGASASVKAHLVYDSGVAL